VIDWDDLRFLLAIRESGSASSAARKLGVDKATVARRVSGLETELGVRLLVRRASGWRTTAAGERAASLAKDVSRRVLELRSEFAGVAGAPRTTVSVTAPHWFCSELLLPALPGLLEEAPWLDVVVAATSRVLSMAQRDADVALRNSRPEQGDFVVRKAGELGSALYAARAYAKKHRFPSSRSGWSQLRLVAYPERVTYVPGFRWLEELAPETAGIVRTDDARALAVALKAGLGVGVIPCFIGDREQSLVRFGQERHTENIWLVSQSELAATRAVKLTMSFIASIFAKHRAALVG
jgi:DNA-binding transcriptional LysR family regulator